MATAVDLGAYKDAMIVLGTAGVIVPLVQRFKVSPILAFLLAGALLGPKGIGALSGSLPGLQWITISHQDDVARIAEFGVVFLLFLIGLELTLPRLMTMRRLVFGLGGLQVALSAVCIGAFTGFLGGAPAGALIIGAALSLSSTAIVIELLARQHRLTSATGRASFAVLLFQDLAVVPLMFLVGILGTRTDGSITLGLLNALAQGAIAIAAIVLIGHVLLRPLFRMAALAASHEFFIAATLFVAVGASLLTAAAGLSMALGAFVTGLLLAETEYRRAIEATIEPFKGLLLGVFFFSVGMSLDVGTLLSDPVWLLAAAAGLIALKAIILAGLARLFRLSWPVAAETGLLLGPAGEFAFVILGLAVAYNLVQPAAGSAALAVVSLTMALIPACGMLGRAFARRLEAPHALGAEIMAAPPHDAAVRAIVIGHGRVGQLVSEMLERHGVPYLSTDRDPVIVGKWRREGRPVYFGDASREQFLRRCGIETASGVIITIHTLSGIDEIVQTVRAIRPDIAIVARARDAAHARHLYDLGVTDAVPETIEAGLQLSEAALVGIGLPTGLVIASIHEKRDEFRYDLQQAAGRVGRRSRAIRSSQRERRAGSSES